MVEYIDNYLEKSDVVDELRPYLTLSTFDDRVALCKKIHNRVMATEKQLEDHGESKALTANVTLLRWKFVLHKLSRALGQYSGALFNDDGRQRVAMEMFGVFL